MKPLQRLIRLHQSKLDDERSTLAALEAREQELRTAATTLEIEFEQECLLASLSPDGTLSLPGYIEGVRHRRNGFALALQDIALDLETARERVREAYGELKRFEIMGEQRALAEKRAATRREQSTLDELGLTMYRRRSKTH
jgi:flagellar export protein FliJ